MGRNIVAQLDFPARDPTNNYDRSPEDATPTHPARFNSSAQKKKKKKKNKKKKKTKKKQDSILHTGTCFVLGKEGIIRQA